MNNGSHEDKDQRWRELGQKLLEASAAEDWLVMRDIYFEQADILREEKKNTFNVLREGMRCELNYAKQNGAAIAGIATAKDDKVCDKCQALQGKKYSMDEAIKQMPLPVDHGKEYECRCVYIYRTQEGKDLERE
jgi:hypothetical protein